MITEEKSKLLMQQQRMLDQKDAQAAEAERKYDALVDTMDRMLAKQDESALESAKLRSLVEEQSAQIRIFEKEKRDLQRRLDDALATIAAMSKDKFKGTSQKSKQN